MAFPLSWLNFFLPMISLETRTMGAKGPLAPGFPIRVTILIALPAPGTQAKGQFQ